MTDHFANETLDHAALDALALVHDARRGEVMLAAVHGFLGRFVSYPSEHAQTAHALWIVHAHLMERWDSTPRLAFLSPEPASGKTRALEITELLVPQPVAAVNVTPAYLFRKMGSEAGPPTVLFDEVDTVFGPKAKDNEEIRGLLNAGHRRGAKAGRCAVVGKVVTTEEIPAYSAVALAGLGWLPDTILSRSIIIRMRRRSAGEQVEAYRRRVHEQEGARIRFMIETWAAGASIEWPELPPEIQDRDADVWEPIIAIADAIGAEWPERARVAAVALVGASRQAEPSLGIRLLADIRTAFGEHKSMATATLLDRLRALDESPWHDLKGRPLDDRGLAQRLKQYDIRSRTIRIGDHTPRGYERCDFLDVWERYLPRPPATSTTGATFETAAGVAHVADVVPLPRRAGGPS